MAWDFQNRMEEVRASRGLAAGDVRTNLLLNPNYGHR